MAQVEAEAIVRTSFPTGPAYIQEWCGQDDGLPADAVQASGTACGIADRLRTTRAHVRRRIRRQGSELHRSICRVIRFLVSAALSKLTAQVIEAPKTHGMLLRKRDSCAVTPGRPGTALESGGVLP